MRRGVAAWLLSVPVALAGCLAAHSLAYRLVEPDAHERAHLLASSGHGYLGYVRVLAAAGLALALAGFLRQATLAARGLDTGGPSRLVVLVPPFAFALQEHLERLLHEGAFPAEALAAPTFLVGLALQLPFALLALAAATLLARTAAALGRVVARAPRPAPTLLVPVPASPARRVAPGLAARCRAPPLPTRP